MGSFPQKGSSGFLQDIIAVELIFVFGLDLNQLFLRNHLSYSQQGRQDKHGNCYR